MKKIKLAVICIISALMLCGCEEYKENSRTEISDNEQLYENFADEFQCSDADGGIVIEKYTGSSENAVIPKQIDGKDVVEIGSRAFENCGEIKRIEIPETVVRTGKSDCLKFYEGSEQNAEKLIFDGRNVQDAGAFYDSNNGEYGVQLELDEEGTKIFAEATERLTGQVISIWADDELLIAPTVANPITDGMAVISGSLTVESAMELKDRILGNPFVYCKNAKFTYKGKTYGYDDIDELYSVING